MDVQTILQAIRSPIGAAIIAGLVLLYLEYRTKWFAQHLARQGSETNRRSTEGQTADSVIITGLKGMRYLVSSDDMVRGERLVTARFEIETHSSKAQYFDWVGIRLEFRPRFDDNVTPRMLFDGIFGHTLVLSTGLRIGEDTSFPPFYRASSSLSLNDEEFRGLRLALTLPGWRVMLLDAINDTVLHLDRNIELSSHTNRSLWDIGVCYCESQGSLFDQLNLKPINVYLDLKELSGQTYSGKARIEGSSHLSPETNTRTYHRFFTAKGSGEER